ncbi:MAG TPA: hypothetical protein VEA36_03365 [Candidatus Paceibacterota bacterium]|nr:hypothetical protein [Candidatus Paceibacterota bacterium]
MRAVLFASFFAAALHYGPPALAQPSADLAARSALAQAVRPGLRAPAEFAVAPPVDTRSANPINVRVVPHHDCFAQPFAPQEACEEEREFVLEYKPSTGPDTVFGRLMFRGLKELYEGQRPKKEPRGGPKGPLLPTPDGWEVKGQIVLPLCPVGSGRKC